MKFRGLIGLVLLLASFSPAFSQAVVVNTCGALASPLPVNSRGQALTIDSSGQLCTGGSFSSSTAGFAPVTTGTPIAVTTGGVTGTLPAGTVVAAYNTGGTNDAFCKLGASATTSDILIAPKSWFAFTVGAATQLTCITSTSTTSVNMVGGSGLPTGAGGGGGSGGGGGAVTIADGASATLGAIADAAATAGSTGTVSAKFRLMTTQLGTINTTLGTPFQAGGALAANQTVNVAQINGVTPLMGQGATGTGSHRVTLSNDNTIPTGWPSAANQIADQAPVAAAAATATKSVLLGGQFDTTQKTLTNGQQAALSVSARGAPFVAVGADGFSISNTTFGSTVTSWGAGVLGAMANYGTSPGAVLVPGVNAFVTNTNANGSATSANSSPVVIASDQAPVKVSPQAITTGGASTTGNIAANNTTAVVVKASAGTLYGAQLSGLGSAPAYLKIYNATSATCGSGTPVKRLMIPAASTAANGAGSNITFGPVGVAFGTGITYCITTGIADNDTTAPAASTFLVNLDWL